MKKIYFIVIMAVMTLFTACEDYNAKNFPGYDDAASPTNKVNYEYQLINADYNSISQQILKLAVTKEDSTKAIAISKNKCFVDSTQFMTGISSFLSGKYIFADTSSIAKVSFKYNIPYDTMTVSSSDKYQLLAADYTNMGLGIATNLSLRNSNPDHFLPIWLKTKYPFAYSGNIKLIRYLYDNGASPINIFKAYKVFIYDGNDWIEYNATNNVNAKFTLVNKKWQFKNSEVFSELFTTSLGAFTSYQISGTKTDFTWASYKGVGYAYGNAYQKGAVVIWLVSNEIVLPDNKNLILSFSHAINFFTGEMKLSELTTLSVSTDFTDDVESATWEKLEIKYPESPSWIFIKSGDISLKEYANKKIHLGFIYETFATAQEAWEIKNIIIK